MSEKSDFNEIENNIFVGNHRMTQNKELMKSLNIQRILTIGCKQLDRSLRLSDIYYKYIPFMEKYEELITYFDDCFAFITESQIYSKITLKSN